MKITNEVITELSLAEVTNDGLEVVLTRQIERKLYIATNKVLEALGGKWSRRRASHIFEFDVSPQLEAALNSGEVATDGDFGFFQTTESLARQLVAMADVRRGLDTCLEPSAGMGRIVSALLDAGGYVVAIERHESRRAHLEARFVGRFVGRPGAVLVEPEDDFMDYRAVEPFDRVVMNPPFLRCGKGDHLDHVQHAFDMLAPEGILVSVLPDGVRFRADRRHTAFRAWLLTHGTLEALPEDSFKESGTGVRTCVTRLVRRS